MQSAGEQVRHWPGRLGLAEAQARAGKLPKNPMQAIVGPRHADKLSGSTHILGGLRPTTAGQARRERRVPGSLGLALPTAQDAQLRLSPTSTTTDTAWIVMLRDSGPDGIIANITGGWLRTSLREVDPDHSRPVRRIAAEPPTR